MENVNFKKIILLSLPMVFALALAITLAACMAQANLGLGDSLLGADETTAKPSQLPDQNTVVSLSQLEFSSNGNGSCSLSGIGSCTESLLKVPEYSPAGDRVTSVADSAFLGCKTIKEISLPKSVTTIGAYAFYGSGLQSISISENVSSIGECAFSNCESLTSVTVDSDNEKYSSLDGVLFSKDKSELICYPSGKTNSSYTIRSSVKKIHKMAFYNCSSLKTVNYNGTKADWAEIEIGPNNDSLNLAEIKFPSSDK